MAYQKLATTFPDAVVVLAETFLLTLKKWNHDLVDSTDIIY